MTEKDINKLKASPKIDKLIAKKVMGWKAVYVRGGSDFSIGDGYKSFKTCAADCKKGEYPVLHWMIETGEIGYGMDWSPSTDMTKAWSVATKLRAAGKYVGVAIGPGFVRASVQEWRDEYADPLTAWVGFDGECAMDADTAPLAICKAALKSLTKAHMR